jgi:nuclear pore complex protein Nup133
VTDIQLIDKLRNTALYATLRIVPKYILEPQQALEVPTLAEISSRWPGMPPDQVEGVERDYLVERERLGALGLDNDFVRVGEIAANDNLNMGYNGGNN